MTDFIVQAKILPTFWPLASHGIQISFRSAAINHQSGSMSLQTGAPLAAASEGKLEAAAESRDNPRID
jgi:hypothetical protein